MKKLASLVILAIIVSVLLAGCTDEGISPPATKYPRLVLDYLETETEEVTIIYISGVEMTRYANMSLYIDDELVIRKNESYAIEYQTELKSFNITVYADREEARFYYEAQVDVINVEDIIFELSEQDKDIQEIKRGNLPFIRRMNRVQEEEE